MLVWEGVCMFFKATPPQCDAWQCTARQVSGAREGYLSLPFLCYLSMVMFVSAVVSGSRDANLRIWDLNSGTCSGVLSGHVAAVRW